MANNILNKIINKKKQRLNKLKKTISIESLKEKILSTWTPWKLKLLSVAKVIEEGFHRMNPKSVMDKCMSYPLMLKSVPKPIAIPFPLLLNSEKLEVSVTKAFMSYAIDKEVPNGAVYRLPFSNM